MKEIGELLQDAREKKGISLDVISKETKISVRQLRALEEGDFSCFAGKVYLKGALRNYAEAVGIDCRELFALYEHNISKNIPAADGKKVELSKKGEDTAKIDKMFVRKAKRPFPASTLIWLAVFIVVIGGSIWYSYQQVNQNRETVSYPSEVIPDEEKKDAAEITDNALNGHMEEPAAIPEEPRLIFLEGDNTGGIYIIKGVEKKEIELRFKADCWIAVEQDGAFIGQRTYRRGEYHRIANAGETRIRFGNPPAAQVIVNGQEIDLSGFLNPYNLTIRRE